MDEIEQMVAETFKHFHANYGGETVEANIFIPPPAEIEHEIPTAPGILYHLQKGASVFVVRSFVSKSIKVDYQKILNNPEEFPSLRLLEGGTDELDKKLKYFMVENFSAAEIIHDQIANRRFPMREELLCNLSDPGFSWWLMRKPTSLQVSFNISLIDENAVKLGPLGDQQLALKSFTDLSTVLEEAGLQLSVQSEANRVQFSDGEEVLIEELKDLFELGVIGAGMTKLFALLARRVSDQSTLEGLWYFFQEVASIRRFWIQIQYDLEASDQ